MTVGQIMSIIAFLFGLSVAGYYIFRPNHVEKDKS